MKKIFIYSLTTALIWGAAGCKKPSDFGETNTNPDAILTPVVGALLSNAQVSLSGYASTRTEAIYGAQYAQYFSETQYTGVSLYTLPQVSFTSSYNGILKDLQTIIDADKSKAESAVATIMQQYVYWVITDNWGDVPYTESLKGTDLLTPAYDTQETIYKGILAKTTAAIGDLNTDAITGDIIYGGDAAKWKKAANTLRVLVSIQLSKVYPGAGDYAATQFKAAVASGPIEANADNFKVVYPGDNYLSPWFSLYDGRKDYGESDTMTDILSGNSDDRITVYGGASEDAGSTSQSTQGFPYGLERTRALDFFNTNPAWARVLRGDLRTKSGSVFILTAAETWLARAEAANIGWTTEVAATDYRTGITASYAQYGLGTPSAGLTTLSGTTATAYGQISTQRWIASYPDGHQGWNIWRKSGFPVLTPAPDASNASKKIVRRLVYASTEYSTNGDNVKAAAARISGGDTQDSRVWWDK